MAGLSPVAQPTEPRLHGSTWEAKRGGVGAAWRAAGWGGEGVSGGRRARGGGGPLGHGGGGAAETIRRRQPAAMRAVKLEPAAAAAAARRAAAARPRGAAPVPALPASARALTCTTEPRTASGSSGCSRKLHSRNAMSGPNSFLICDLFRIFEEVYMRLWELQGPPRRASSRLAERVKPGPRARPAPPPRRPAAPPPLDQRALTCRTCAPGRPPSRAGGPRGTQTAV